MLSAIWVLIMFIIAALAWFSSSLKYAAGFLVMLGIAGALLLNSKWLYGIIGLCCTVALLAAAFYFEPGWFNALLQAFSF
jgi:hypothetical protein